MESVPWEEAPTRGRPYRKINCYIPEGQYTASEFYLKFTDVIREGLVTIYGSSKKQMGVPSPDWPLNYDGPREPEMFFVKITERKEQYYVSFNIHDDYHLATRLRININPALQYLLGMVAYMGADYGGIAWERKEEKRKV